MAEQIDELLVWDRAVRADAWDSVHQMRVTTRKIRSLVKGSEESFGLTDDSPGSSTSSRQLAGVLGVARDAEVLAERYEKALDELPADLVRGPVRERLVDGAKQRYQAGQRRSLIAMRSARYFRLLDALDALGGHRATVGLAGRRGARQTTRRRRPTSRSARQPRRPRPRLPTSEQRRGPASDPQARQADFATPRAATGADKVADRAPSPFRSLLGDHQDSVVSRTHLQQRGRDRVRRRRGHLHLRGALSARRRSGARRDEDLGAALKKLDKSVRKDLLTRRTVRCACAKVARRTRASRRAVRARTALSAI